MTEKIIRAISEMTGLDTRLKLSEKNSISLYPENARTLVKFCDGGDLQRVTVKLKIKGEVPSEMFAALEKACEKIEASGEETAVFRVAVQPCFEACNEAGTYIAACTFTADYIREGAEYEDSI